MSLIHKCVFVCVCGERDSRVISLAVLFSRLIFSPCMQTVPSYSKEKRCTHLRFRTGDRTSTVSSRFTCFRLLVQVWQGQRVWQSAHAGRGRRAFIMGTSLFLWKRYVTNRLKSRRTNEGQKQACHVHRNGTVSSHPVWAVSQSTLQACFGQMYTLQVRQWSRSIMSAA